MDNELKYKVAWQSLQFDLTVILPNVTRTVVRSMSFHFPYLAVPSRVYIFILSMRFISLRSTALVRTLIIGPSFMSHGYL
jgi:hypothetical protein